jgi:hypothetical protein
MNASPRTMIPSASLGLAVGLTAYLLVCLSARFVRQTRSAVGAWFSHQFNAQRRIRRMLVTVGIFAVAITLGISAGGSTFALWNVSTPIGAASLSTGTTGITVNGSTSYTVPGLTTTQLLPGLSAVSPVILSIVNTGTTPLSISVGTPVFTDPSSLLAQNGNLVVSLFQSTTCAQTVDGSGTAAWTAPVVVPAGGSVSACLQMTLSASAPASVQGLSATFTLPITGTQVRNNP